MMELQEQVLQRLPHRCPYCDEVVFYEQMNLKEGDNLVPCPTCKKTYVKIISKLSEDETR